MNTILNLKRNLNNIIPPICTQSWMTFFITIDGDVTPCCNDVDCELKIGNIKEDSIYDLWHNEEINRIRKIHKKREFYKLKPCKTCDILRN